MESDSGIQTRGTECAWNTNRMSDNFECEMSAIPDFSNLLLSSSDESELKDIAGSGALVPIQTYKDDNFNVTIQADTFEENSTSPTSNAVVDPKLPRYGYLDFQYCLMCKTKEKDFSYPYCRSCFLKKKDFFPPRPDKMKKRGIRGSINNNNSNSKNLSDADGGKSINGVKFNSQESGFDKDSCSVDERILCKVCYVRKINGVFVHASSGHMHSCFTCAKKTWERTGVCPLCKKKCRGVIKLYPAFD